MGVKTKIISEIDSLLSEYTTKKDNSRVVPGEEAGFHAILGAIDALEFLKKTN